MAPPARREPISSEEAQRRLAALREARMKELSKRSEKPREDKPWMRMKVRRKNASKKPAVRI
jgi:hypothetical protein